MNPLLAAIPAAGRATAASVVSAVTGGLTQRAAISAIRAAGFPFSARNPWGRLLSYSRDAAKYASFLKNIRHDARPNTERLPFSLGEQRRLYSWTVRFDLVNEEGDQYEQFLTVSTDDPRKTVSQLLKAARDSFVQGSGDVDMEITNAVLVGGTRRYDT